MSSTLTQISFIKKLSLILHRKAYLIYTDNPIPSLLIPLPFTCKSSIKSSLYKIFTDLTNNQIITFHNKNFIQKDLNNIQRQHKARLYIDKKDVPDKVEMDNVENMEVKNDTVFLTAIGQDGVLKFMTYKQIMEKIGKVEKNQNVYKVKKSQNLDEVMDVKRQEKRRNQKQQQRAEGNVQSPSVDSRKQAGMPYENQPYSKQSQAGKPSRKKPSFGTVQPGGKSQQSYSQQMTKLKSQVQHGKPEQSRISKERRQQIQRTFDLQHPPRTIPNHILTNQQHQKYQQGNIQHPPILSKSQQRTQQQYTQSYHQQKYFKSYELFDNQKNQKIIPLAILTDNITTKPINIIHIQTSRQYLFMQVLKVLFIVNLFCVYRVIKDGTRVENYNEIKKHFQN